MKISALTIVRGRQKHLENQWRGWLRSDIKPHRWIIVGMNQEVVVPGHDPSVEILTDQVIARGESLPLASARNVAANLCETDAMVFLDVDCIPSPSMLTHFAQAIHNENRLWMGSPRYLPRGATDGDWTFEGLDQSGIRHPIQPSLTRGELRSSDEYEKFWSLCFGVSKETYQRIGGFDESFAGYGAEDTDFAFATRQADVPFGFVGAVAYHQHHAVCKPPLNHFDAIVRNAVQFRRRWNAWPMQGWLDAFANLGMIRYVPDSDELQVLTHPTKQQVEQATVMTPAGF
ncbi:glycosyltransferase family 2 protein [Neorhodopirellula pilleata]|uniref:Uncharacterized protein n=1 Tax=Neorhodopirellula pilleata TaxID=2714738 RepID=A0A5C6A344_9BACT|nr:glycosyltransferase family 2 protein [Neorhodopirellula pilleata]TWT93611.1 hypothetical protein Pla100_41290 [Neorhodopirellula pilleata]